MCVWHPIRGVHVHPIPPSFKRFFGRKYFFTIIVKIDYYNYCIVIINSKEGPEIVHVESGIRTSLLCCTVLFCTGFVQLSIWTVVQPSTMPALNAGIPCLPLQLRSSTVKLDGFI